MFYPLYLLFSKIGIPSWKQNSKKSYILGINVNLPSLFGYNHHYIDFIVQDNNEFPKKDILFIDERFKHEIDKISYLLREYGSAFQVYYNIFPCTR